MARSLHAPGNTGNDMRDSLSTGFFVSDGVYWLEKNDEIGCSEFYTIVGL